MRSIFQKIGLAAVIGIMLGATGSARVDTLKDTSDIEDCVIYSQVSCNPEETGENCRRYNGGRAYNMGIGNSSCCDEQRVVCWLPGWNDTIPDSSEMMLYCFVEVSSQPRWLIAYPMITESFEGDEAGYGIGYYPEPDSGATWLHAYLDVGDGDSALWTNPGGDYTTAVACSVLISGTGQYFTMRNFNRILNYWDTSDANYGFILVNANDFPTNLSKKIIKSSESGRGLYPLVLLYTADSTQAMRRSQTVRSQLRN